VRPHLAWANCRRRRPDVGSFIRWAATLGSAKGHPDRQRPDSGRVRNARRVQEAAARHDRLEVRVHAKNAEFRGSEERRTEGASAIRGAAGSPCSGRVSPDPADDGAEGRIRAKARRSRALAGNQLPASVRSWPDPPAWRRRPRSLRRRHLRHGTWQPLDVRRGEHRDGFAQVRHEALMLAPTSHCVAPRRMFRLTFRLAVRASAARVGRLR